MSNALTTVTADQLRRSNLNPRQAHDPAHLDALAESIATQGLLQNLVARPHPTIKGAFEIAAGDSRYQAIERLIKAGRLPKDFAIPVQVNAMDDRDMIKLGLIENAQREDLHPLDEGEAYAKLIDLGFSVAEVAEVVPFSKRHVELRLQLHRNLTPATKNEFRAGKIDLARARQIAAHCPADRQKAIVQRLKDTKDHRYSTAEDVGRALRYESIPERRAIFDPKRYDGPWHENPDDPGDRYFGDVDKFFALQDEAVEALAKSCGKKAAWVEVERTKDECWEGRSKYRNRMAHGAPKKFDGKPLAGTVIRYDVNGAVQVESDQVRPDDLKRWQAAEAAKAKGKPGAPEAGGAAEEPGDKLLPTLAGLQIVKTEKTNALRKAIADDPDRPAAAARAMRLAILGLLGGGGTDLLIESNASRAYGQEKVGPPDWLRQRLDARLKSFGKLVVFRDDDVGPEIAGTFDVTPTKRDAQAEAWRLLCALSDDDVRDLFVDLVAVHCGTFLDYGKRAGDRPLICALAADLGVEVKAGYQPDAAFLKTLTLPALRAYARQAGLFPFAGDLERLLATGPKKAAIVAIVAAIGTKRRADGDVPVDLPPAFDIAPQEAIEKRTAQTAKTPPAKAKTQRQQAIDKARPKKKPKASATPKAKAETSPKAKATASAPAKGKG